MRYQIIVSVVAIVLTIVGYTPYLRDTLRKKTTPHAFTWFIAALAGFISYGLQVLGGGGIGAWVLFTASMINLLIFILSLRVGDKDIIPADGLFLVLSVASWPRFWLAEEEFSAKLRATTRLSRITAPTRKPYVKLR